MARAKATVSEDETVTDETTVTTENTEAKRYAVGDEAVISKGNYRGQKATVLAVDEIGGKYAVKTTDGGEVATVTFSNLRDERPDSNATPTLSAKALAKAIRESASLDELAKVLAERFPSFQKAWEAGNGPS